MRELPSNERPGQWANDTVPGCSDGYASAFGDEGAPGPAGPGATEPDEDDSTALRRRELPPITAPQQYRMQFSTTEEHVRLVERAKALLARMPPGRSLGELHQQAMELLVDMLEKAKFAVTEPRPRARGSGTLAVALDADASQRAQRKPASMASGQTAEEREIEPGEPLQRKRAPRRRGRHDIWLHPRTHPRII